MAKTKYEERLFSGGIRKYIHEARFKWLEKNCKYLVNKETKIIELGCFNGKSLEFLPNSFNNYLGFDANWEGGLSEAKERYLSKKIVFKECIHPRDFALKEKFNLFICLETLEHLPAEDLEIYLLNVKEFLSDKGILMISVPNEIGFLFIIKTIFKKIYFKEKIEYDLKEFIYQALGKVEKVKRNQHKGFSYKILKENLEKLFNVEKIEGLQAPLLPISLNLSVGFVCSLK